MKSTPVFRKLMTEQLYCLIGSEIEQVEEERRANLRKGQRDRRKERVKELKVVKTKTVQRF